LCQYVLKKTKFFNIIHLFDKMYQRKNDNKKNLGAKRFFLTIVARTNKIKKNTLG